MGWAETFFGKIGLKEKNIKDFVTKKIEENLHLEYKDIAKIDDIDGIAIAVSAFANSEGGLLILGVSEKNHFPDRITWGNKKTQKETLEQKLISKIHPQVSGLKIIPIRKNKRSQQVIFLIDIPKSDILHQSPNRIYYQRHNFQKLPMEDYQIRDFLGKRRKPNLDIILEVIEKKNSEGYKKFRVYISNSGGGMAKYISAIMQFPEEETHISDLKVAGNKLQRIDHLYTQRKTIQFVENDGVIHPDIRLNIGQLDVKFKNRKQRLKYSYTICAEDMEKKENNRVI